MATFLTTAKMPPELAARVEASVRGRRTPSAGPSPRAKRTIGRGLVLVAVAVMVWSVAGGLRRYTLEIAEQQKAEDDARAALITAARANAPLAAEGLELRRHVESQLVALSRQHRGDHVSEELRRPHALEALLSRPALYVRGPAASFASSDGIREAAAESVKDAFLYCLLDPPATRAERALLEKVRAVYAGSVKVEERTANVRRLDDVERGLPFFLPPWIERVTAAHEDGEVSALKKELDGAPIEGAKRALGAKLLIVVLDEPAAADGATELDGERPHDVRVALLDPRAEQPSLRLRLQVDPSRISDAARPEYASGIDSCGLALDVRERVTGAAPGAKRAE